VPQEGQTKEQIISERIAPVIEAAAERIHYAEGRRQNFVTIGGVLLAAAVAIFTFAWSAIDLLIIRYSATFGAVAMFAVGFVVIWVFGQQTNRYPWTSATKTWKWFYRDALPAWDKFTISSWSYIPWAWKCSAPRVMAEYESQLATFKTRMMQLSDDSENLSQDLEQLYVLHVNEGYKNLHLTYLRSLLDFGIYVIIIAIVLGALFGWHLETEALKIREFSLGASGYSQKLETRLVVSPLSTQSQYIGRATLSNKGTVAISIGELVARDKNNWELPLSDVTYFDRPSQIQPNTAADFNFSFETPSYVAGQIRSLQIETK